MQECAKFESGRFDMEVKMAEISLHDAGLL